MFMCVVDSVVCEGMMGRVIFFWLLLCCSVRLCISVGVGGSRVLWFFSLLGCWGWLCWLR